MTLDSVMERPGLRESEGARAVSIKSILLHVQDDDTIDERMETALAVARACGAHVSCLHVTPVEAYVAFDGFGGVFVMDDIMKALDESEERLRARVEADLANEDVTWDFVHVTGNIPGQIIRHAAFADLVVTGRSPHRRDFTGPALGILGDLLYRARTPLMIPGTGSEPIEVAGRAVIAWDGSFEAANAVRSAVGLLALASDVRILQIREADKDETFPSTRLLEYLSRHGIHADLHIEPPAGGKGDAIASTLVEQAGESRASYIVMGGYNHSRIGEYLFGGVTRSLLAESKLPLVIAR